MSYAGLDDFESIIKKLMSDPKELPLPMTLGEETACMSLLLRVYLLPDLDENAAFMVIDLCRKFADDIIDRYPFSEWYVDYLFGAAMMARNVR